MVSWVNVGGLSGAGRRDLALLFSNGARTVTIDRAASLLNVGRDEAAKRLAAWTAQGWLRRVRRGLYLSVPMDAPDPRAWSEDPWYLADLVWTPCYVTGWSAANHWSLTDQVFRATVVATTLRVRRVNQELAGSPFVLHHVAADRVGWGLRSEWRHERRVSVADPAKTVAEMLDEPGLGGGIRHVAEVLETHLESAEPAALLNALDRLENGAAFKRLGYLVETSGARHPEIVAACLKRVTAGYADLDPAMPSGGRRIGRWNLRVNVEVEA